MPLITAHYRPVLPSLPICVESYILEGRIKYAIRKITSLVFGNTFDVSNVRHVFRWKCTCCEANGMLKHMLVLDICSSSGILQLDFGPSCFSHRVLVQNCVFTMFRCSNCVYCYTSLCFRCRFVIYLMFLKFCCNL